jgi:hypothetical protein
LLLFGTSCVIFLLSTTTTPEICFNCTQLLPTVLICFFFFIHYSFLPSSLTLTLFSFHTHDRFLTSLP